MREDPLRPRPRRRTQGAVRSAGGGGRPANVPAIAIGARTVGDGHPCYVIAEAGSNHNGSLEQAMHLIDVAAEARADAVKFQVFRAARLYPKSAGFSDYLKVRK